MLFLRRTTRTSTSPSPDAAAYIMKAFAGTNVAILNDKNTYGKGLADETRKALNAAGFREKMFESFNRGEIDFSAIVSRLKRENIDLVYVGGYPLESGLILRQMREQGLKTVLMAGDALYDRAFASTALTQSAVMAARWSRVLGAWPITTSFPGGNE